MGFLDTLRAMEKTDIRAILNGVPSIEVRRSLGKDRLTANDLANLLSPAAAQHLEEMARKAQRLTRQHFGRTIALFAPLYISDHCANHCTYCGFNCSSGFSRTALTHQQIEAEARAIHAMGIRHIVVLTGEAPARTPPEYLEKAVRILKRFFSSIALEMFPMEETDYRRLFKAGADSLTVYQETYHRPTYAEVHPRGKKADFAYRLTTPDRAARAGFRAINIGPLFGLAEPRTEAFKAALHARYLEQRYPDVEISLSLPRITSAEGAVAGTHLLPDHTFVQIMTAWRLFLPRAGITISTREPAPFRDRLLQLGATRFSAGSRTDVGGYTMKTDTTVQFEIADGRSVEEVCRMVRQQGYQPIFKDWEHPA